MSQYLTTIRFNETSGIRRNKEPVTWGMPFPPGLVENSSKLILCDDRMQRHDFFCTPVSFWRDGSIKWLLFDTQVSVDANNGKNILLYSLKAENNYKANPVLKCEEQGGTIAVQTGRAKF